MKIIIWMIAILGIGVGLISQNVTNKTSQNMGTRVEKKVEPPEKVGLSEATNSQGNLKLVGMSRKAAEGRVTYEFKIIDTQKKSEIPIYQTVADPGNQIEVPQNSWSPDYKQVFIKTISPERENYYVFKANGENYGDGSKYLVVDDLWQEANMTSNIKRVTGWAGNDLLMVYTVSEDGWEGPAYWFVTSTRKFMQVREF